MILALSFRLADSIHRYLYAYAPSNILIRHLRSPAGRKLTVPISSVLAVAYLAVAAGLTPIIESGGPGWLNLIALTCFWNAIKYTIVGLEGAGRALLSSLSGRRQQSRSVL